MTKTATGILVGFGLLVLAGCAQLGGSSKADSALQQPDSALQQPVAPYVPKQGLSAQQRIREALMLLEEGDESAARVEVVLYLQQQPRSELGQDLLRQINLPAADYFPTDYRKIELASGQSLSNISNEYLGSVYKFHALAKYNMIAEPRKLAAGQTIRIPLTDKALAVFESQDSGSVDAAVDDPAEDSLIETEVVEAVETESAEIVEVETVEVNEVEIVAAPDVEKMHREALNAYRAQDLSKAIDLWDQVLAVDPGYENASLYRAQAIQLQNKLRNLQ